MWQSRPCAALRGPARLAGPLIGWIGRRQERTIWTGLKELLEGTGRAPWPGPSSSVEA